MHCFVSSGSSDVGLSCVIQDIVLLSQGLQLQDASTSGCVIIFFVVVLVVFRHLGHLGATFV